MEETMEKRPPVWSVVVLMVLLCVALVVLVRTDGDVQRLRTQVAVLRAHVSSVETERDGLKAAWRGAEDALVRRTREWEACSAELSSRHVSSGPLVISEWFDEKSVVVPTFERGRRFDE